MSNYQRFLQWIAATPSLFESHPPFTALNHLNVDLKALDKPYTGNQRLGFLYQHLCSEILQQSESYEIHLEEVQLNEPSGRTLGAIDLILNHHQTGQFEHWEVAIKFYLLHQGVWYGPNAHDQLDKKLDRMLNHQLAMSRHPAFTDANPDIIEPEQRLLMQGRLYVNPFSDEPVPTHCLNYPLTRSQISGNWCYQDQWQRIGKPLYEVPKHQWATGLDSFDNALSEVEGKFVHAQTEDGEFWFIVSRDWPS